MVGKWPFGTILSVLLISSKGSPSTFQLAPQDHGSYVSARAPPPGTCPPLRQWSRLKLREQCTKQGPQATGNGGFPTGGKGASSRCRLLFWETLESFPTAITSLPFSVSWRLLKVRFWVASTDSG